MKISKRLRRLAPTPLLFLAITSCSKDPAAPPAKAPPAAPPAKATHPTITLTPSTGPQVHDSPIYQDDAYSFEIQDFGHSVVKLSDFALEPGVFVFSKSKQQWMRIDRISTAGAKWGYAVWKSSYPRQIGWDFRLLAKEPSVQIPLYYSSAAALAASSPTPKSRQTGIVDLPDSITFDSQQNSYRIGFDALAPDAAEVSTILVVDRADLDRAFEK